MANTHPVSDLNVYLDDAQLVLLGPVQAEPVPLQTEPVITHGLVGPDLVGVEGGPVESHAPELDEIALIFRNFDQSCQTRRDEIEEEKSATAKREIRLRPYREGHRRTPAETGGRRFARRPTVGHEPEGCGRRRWPPGLHEHRPEKG